jgi:hypothetical protein
MTVVKTMTRMTRVTTRMTTTTTTTTRWVRRTLFAALVLMPAACSQSTAPEGDQDFTLIPSVQEFTLRVGDEKAVGGSVLRLSFGRVVEDSRCPVDAICVWEGRGVAEVGVRAGMGPTVPLKLGTETDERTVVWNGVRVTLLEFGPAARLDPALKESDYAIRVRVEVDGG